MASGDSQSEGKQNKMPLNEHTLLENKPNEKFYNITFKYAYAGDHWLFLWRPGCLFDSICQKGGGVQDSPSWIKATGC